MPDLASGTTTGRSPDFRYALIGLGILVLSSAFPIFASIVPAERLPKWLGGLDVITAVALFVPAVILNRSAQTHIDETVIRTSYRVYRVLIHFPLALLAAFFVFTNRINWPVLLTGLAWRYWLLCYVLFSGMAAWSGRRPQPA